MMSWVLGRAHKGHGAAIRPDLRVARRAQREDVPARERAAGRILRLGERPGCAQHGERGDKDGWTHEYPPERTAA
jgi:hypothetical protein